jgi:hypothetical protein
MREKITVKKDRHYVRVYSNGSHMWTKNLKNPLRSWGATRYAKYADEYIIQPRNRNYRTNIRHNNGSGNIRQRMASTKNMELAIKKVIPS